MVSVFQLIGRIIAKKLSEKRWFNPLSLTRKGFTDLKEAGVNRKWRSLLVASTAACIPVYNEVTDGHSYTVEYIVVQVEYGNRRTRKYKKWAKAWVYWRWERLKFRNLFIVQQTQSPISDWSHPVCQRCLDSWCSPSSGPHGLARSAGYSSPHPGQQTLASEDVKFAVRQVDLFRTCNPMTGQFWMAPKI